MPMTRLPGVPDNRDLKPGMAFFADTGPFGKTCGDCKFRGYYRQAQREHWSEQLQQNVVSSYKVQKCEKARQMAGGRHLADVDKDNHACKYFEQKVQE